MPESMRELLGHLEARRSVPAVQLAAPGPTPDELHRLLTIAARVPDHGKLAPWRFIVLDADSRADLADRLDAARRVSEPDVLAERLEKDRATFLAAPAIVTVVSRTAAHPKIPEWEQLLSAGAVCLNLLHGAHALGFRAQWLTGWATYDMAAKGILGIDAAENIAGFIHIGSTETAPTDRTRPDVAALTTRWSAQV